MRKMYKNMIFFSSYTLIEYLLTNTDTIYPLFSHRNYAQPGTNRTVIRRNIFSKLIQFYEVTSIYSFFYIYLLFYIFFMCPERRNNKAAKSGKVKRRGSGASLNFPFLFLSAFTLSPSPVLTEAER